jgi:multidrug resistance efflux pump
MTPRPLLYAVVAATLLSACGKSPPPAPLVLDASEIAAGGLVEPSGEERVVIPQLSGRLARVYVDEGDTVTAGQLLAEIENAEYRAAVAAAEAHVALRQAELDKLVHGARVEELAAARAARAEAVAGEQVARAELKRREPMAARELISAEQLEQARAQADAATARREQAAAQLALLEAGARSEDRAAAEGALAAARAERDRAQALFQKSQIVAPVAGVVLKRELSEGETVVALSPLPLARIGDLAKLYVRADIDELDIGRIRIGQKARITSDAFRGREFTGEVVRVSRRMGKRSALSGNPAEKQDSKVLEALIALDGAPPLPVGLRVDAHIATK